MFANVFFIFVKFLTFFNVFYFYLNVFFYICGVRAGDYGIHVKYNDEHVPNSPAFVHIAPESKDATLVTVHGLRDRGLDVSADSAKFT